jgi:FkbH-like protein
MQSNSSNKPSPVDAVRQLQIPGSSTEEIDRLASSLKTTDYSKDPSLKPLRVIVLGNITTNYIVDHIRLMLVRNGYAAAIEPGEYGGLVRGLLGEYDLSPKTCDAAILLLSHRDVQFPPSAGISTNEARRLVEKETEFWASLLQRLAVPAVVLSFDLPPWRVLDEQDGLSPGGLGWHVRMTNLELAGRLSATVSLVDAEVLQYQVGAAQWYDERLYHLCKQPYAMDSLPQITHSLVAALMGQLGRSRKVLVLDLDNTLWGGVIGDDGLNGIALGPESPEGEAFVAFQGYAKSLRARGIILAVCSKNLEAVARSPFREHTAMVLKEDDISCFIANFEDKAKNIRQIAKALNLGLDSMVFVDDNPVERALIRAELPEVLVVEVPDDPALYIRALEAARAFPLRLLTSEDLTRAASYRAMNAVREASTGSATDMEQFLSGLSPCVHVENVDESSVDRIVQLIRKTNQFKWNRSAFEEAEILSGAGDVLALRLTDRLQDYGIVAIAVTKPEGDTLLIQNWVMSCRVFGRRLEHVMTGLLCQKARSGGCTSLQGTYTPSEKNVIIPEILVNLGFAPVAESAEYRRATALDPQDPHYMTIVDKRKIYHE